MEDLYKTLGVEPEADATLIKRRYRQLAKELHPDATGGDPVKTARFQEVSVAYAVLNNEAKRAQYDRERKSEQGSTYSSLFGPELDEIIERINSEGFSVDVFEDFLAYGQKFHKEAPEKMRKMAQERTESARKSTKFGQFMDVLEDLFDTGTTPKGRR